MNTKEAMDNHELLKLTLKSLLVGGGTYGAARLGKDIYNEFKGPEKPKNELPVFIPQKMAEEGQDVPYIRTYVAPALGAIGGVGAGFFGASKLYDTVKNHFLQKELKKKQEEYVRTLQQVNQKMGSHPYVDELLTGMISKIGEAVLLEKTGGEGYLPTTSEQFSDLAGEAGHAISHGASNAWDWIKGRAGDAGKALGNVGSSAVNNAKDALSKAWNQTETGAQLKAGLLLTVLAGGGATYAIAKNLEKKKEEAARQSQIPTDLKLTPVSSSPNAIPGQSH